jgi:hypothetical protein
MFVKRLATPSSALRLGDAPSRRSEDEGGSQVRARQPDKTKSP